MKRVLETLAVLQWVFTFLCLGFSCVLLFIYLLFTKFWFLSVAYVIFFFLDRNTPSRGGRRQQAVREWRLWRYMASYFPAKLHKTATLSPEENHIVCCHPHGVFSTGAFLHFVTEATGFSKLFPGITSHLSVLDGHFAFPFYRDYFMTGGAIAVNSKSLDYVLGGRKGRGNLVCLLPGGAVEALDSHPGKYRVNLKSKYGFVRVALKAGANLIPCISFGETRLYQQMENAPNSWLRKLQNLLLPFFGFSMPIFYGRGILPFRQPINTVVGAPIKVNKTANPTKAEIAELKAKYTEELRALFEKYKPIYDPEAADLDIY